MELGGRLKLTSLLPFKTYYELLSSQASAPPPLFGWLLLAVCDVDCGGWCVRIIGGGWCGSGGGETLTGITERTNRLRCVFNGGLLMSTKKVAATAVLKC